MKPTRAVVALAAAAAMCGGCKQDEPPKMARPVATTGAAAVLAATSTTTTTAPPSPYAEVQGVLLDTVPVGFTLQAEDVGDAGPVDLEKAVREDGDADAREALTAAGFDAGYERVWVNDREDEIVAYLYRFRDPSGARAYTDRLSAGSTADDGFEAFAVTGIPGAKGFSGEIETGTSSIVLFSKGVYAAQVVVNGASSGGQRELVTSLAADQYVRLP